MILTFSPGLPSVPALSAERDADRSLLGGTVIGIDCQAAGAPRCWPLQALVAPLLGSTLRTGNVLYELWWSEGDECLGGAYQGVVFRRTDDVIFGVVDIDERDCMPSASGWPLRDAAEAAYRRILALLDAQRLPFLWRVWNYLPDINCEGNGLERYRQFNIGRHEAFVALGRAATGGVPAACALGLRQGSLTIAFLGGRTPARAIENPRQLSAYYYPQEYGPRSPTFSRAVLVELSAQEFLFISGTASIFGHRTVHPGDVAGQSLEALANLEAVLAEANRHCHSAPFLPEELCYRVYVRHAGDFPTVRDLLAERVNAAADVVFVQADICRLDLLVEIEATGCHRRESC